MSQAPLRKLTAEEIAAYQRDGVICASGLFQREWIERMTKAVDYAVANPGFFGLMMSRKSANFSHDLFLWKKLPEFRAFVFESPAARIAQQLLQTDQVNFFYDQMFVKPVGCYMATPWHQDITFWPVDSAQIVSIWMPFDKVTRESSGLEFIRGSHLWTDRYKAVSPTYDPLLLDSPLPPPPDINNNRDQYDLINWDMEPGDVVIFSPLTMHGSSGNYTMDKPRRALSTRWAAPTVRYAPTPSTMPMIYRHDLKPGDPLSGRLFPRVLPQPLAEETTHTPEWPSVSHIGRMLKRQFSAAIKLKIQALKAS